ncbi:hypothetical protein BG004_000273 [Podila humilis]|nr:hypothetical protein BG004_000273 [Podila humilis]
MSNFIYQLPISNITHHVCSRDEELDLNHEISRRAFQRTMDSYHEHEHLADVFQVELDKQQQLSRERKEREKMLKQQKHKSTSTTSSSLSKRQPRTHHHTHTYTHTQTHPHPYLPVHRQNLYSALFPSSSSAAALPLSSSPSIASSTGHTHSSSSNLHHQLSDQKRPRRLSDISNSNGDYGSNAARMPKAHDDNNNIARSASIDPSRSNDRSQSSTPTYPLTPSPRLIPATSSHLPTDLQDAIGAPQSTVSSSSTSTPPKSSPPSEPRPTEPSSQHMYSPFSTVTNGGRKKRKQAIPVRASVIDRIPGITLRIQPDGQGEQLQVEILKNVEDYPRAQPSSGKEDIGTLPMSTKDSNTSAGSRLESDVQAEQDMAKVKQSIEAGRAGYAIFPPSGFAGYHSLQHYPEHSLTTIHRDSDSLTKREKSSSATSLEWMSVMETLMAQQEYIESRAQPLSWETFSTRDCVMNKVIGKHDDDLETLEEVLQDTLNRQCHQSSPSSHQDRDSEPATTSPTNATSTNNQSQKKPILFSSTSNGNKRRPSKASATATAASTLPVSASASASASVSASASATHSVPVRATRSRTDKKGRRGAPQLVEGYEDIESVLKEKRRKKREERERLSSRASSTATHQEDEDDERRSHTRESSMDKSADHAMDTVHRSDGEEDANGDINMDRLSKQNARKRNQGSENGSISGTIQVNIPPRKKSLSTKSQQSQGGSGAASTEQSTDESSEDDQDVDPDYKYLGNKMALAALAAGGQSSSSSSSQTMRPPQLPQPLPAGTSSEAVAAAGSRARRPSFSRISPPPTPTQAKQSTERANNTRARAKSFSSTIVTSENFNFYESALATIAQKRRDTLAKKKAEDQKRETEANAKREIKEQQAQKVESSNLPKSSKSLPGRVLRRTRGDAADTMVDPDCTSCRLELSSLDKAGWKSAVEDGEIKLPKTWGSHAILCTTCRLQYLEHHTRCTACFYVPVMEEMDAGGSDCSRCKFGTWLDESPRVVGNNTTSSSSRHRKTASEVSV